MIVGLTGGIGSGKTTVLELFNAIGNIAIYNADVEAKKLMNTSVVIKAKITKAFGVASYKGGTLNKRYLSELVFSDKDKLKLLNSIVHPEVYAHLQAFVLSNREKTYIVYENAILFENNSDIMCDYVIAVVADESLKMKRVMERDLTTKEAVLKRMNNQWTDTKKALQSNYIIENYDVATTKLQIKRIHNNLTKKKG
ncbi:MAG: dephospho-CoA kinase [Polaribacter sp.]|nr:dephospho-CoA kinase [Polaribacter sp.]